MKKTGYITFLGLLCALAAVLSFVESLIPTSGLLPPGVKLGLSNIITMFAAFSLGIPGTLTVAVSKALFALLTRGMTAGLLSLAGGVLSGVAVCMIIKLDRNQKLGFAGISIVGAICHNAGQLVVVSLLTTKAAFMYAPVLLISGAAAGTVTSLILKSVWRYIKKLEMTVRRSRTKGEI